MINFYPPSQAGLFQVQITGQQVKVKKQSLLSNRLNFKK